MNSREKTSKRCVLSFLLIIFPGIFIAVFQAQVTHPSIFLLPESSDRFRSIADFKEVEQSNRVNNYIETLKLEAKADLKLPFIDPTTPFAGRDSIHLRHKNVSYDMVIGLRDRLSRSAFLFLLTENAIYKDLIMNQIDALADTTRWPLWCDKAHLFEEPYVDIRTYRISMWIALCYNWLYHDLSTAEKQFIVDLIDRRAIRPFWKKLAQKPHWYVNRHNWFTNIFGGMGITAMALGKDHPDTKSLLDTIVPNLIQFNEIIGDLGEFNEPPGYAGAVRYSVEFAEAYRYYTKNEINLLRHHPFPALCYWMMYHTIPPQRLTAFGDTPIDAHPRGSEVMVAVASASQDEVLQWYYHENFPSISNIMELLWYDPSLDSRHPKGILPLAMAYQEHSASIISRSSWDQDSSAIVVYGKAGRETNHDDNDVGQLLVDGFGKRLIIDCGKPDPIYPADYFRDSIQFNYYTRSTLGHNVLMIENREMRSEPNATARGEITHFWSDDSLGSSWTIDLTPVYPNSRRVKRSVAHLLPGLVAVYDFAQLEKESTISLRWHTASKPAFDHQANFSIEHGDIRLVGKMIALNQESIKLSGKHHHFKPPFHLSRQGDPLVQVNQSYLEFIINTREYATLTLFAISKQGHTNIWKSIEDGWCIELPSDKYYVKIEDDSLTLTSEQYPQPSIKLSIQR